MRRMCIVLHRDLKELRQTNAFRVITILSVVVMIGGAIGVSVAPGRSDLSVQGTSIPSLEMIIGMIAYFIPFIILMSFIWVFASLPVTKEKVSGNIDSLLATPLSPVEIWVGKNLAIFIPAYIISAVVTIVIVLSANFTAIFFSTGDLVIPFGALVVGLVVNPLLFLGLLAFIILFSLANNPDIAIAPSFIIGFGLMMGIPLGIAIEAIDLNSLVFALWYLVGVIIVWIVIFCLSRLLTRENIVLSSKGS